MRRAVRRALTWLAVPVMLAGFSLYAPIAQAGGPVTALSTYGTQGIGELASCLRTGQNLDVYYLVDSSTSLLQTDPQNQRADILTQDISRWSDILSIQPNLKIRIAGAVFNSAASPLIDWTSLEKDNSSAVARKLVNKVNNKNLGNFTNWRGALEYAYAELGASSADCKTVIWFTDGGLWPSTSGNRLKGALRDLQYLCGDTDSTGLPREKSDKGLLARMRADQIHIFGILLNAGQDTEVDEPFYRSLMKPVIEESGAVIQLNGLPSGQILCGENVPIENRQYAAGAFLEAHSAADVAFNFMTIPAIVSGATMAKCPADGAFWVDPGLGSFEYNTDAKSWVVLDQEQKVVAKSGADSQNLSTGKIPVPALTEPELWNFKTEGGDGRCSLFVYPELYLELHQKSLITGAQSSITGQFVTSLTSKRKATFVPYKKVTFNAKVDGQLVDAQLDKNSGQFVIKNYTPTVSGEARVEATLTLETQHYVLDPISFRQTEKVFDSSVIPNVGQIKFIKVLSGAKGTSTAQVSIEPSPNRVSSKICFESPQIIADVQDESSGRATDRSAKWKWEIRGLDTTGCLALSADTNRKQIVSFVVRNPVQANSKVTALFNYSVTVEGNTEAGFQDSQTAGLKTEVQTDATSFWLFLLLFSFLGFAIPFGILTAINWPMARFTVPPGTNRAEIAAIYDSTSRTIEFRGHYLNDADATGGFRPAAVPSGQSSVTDPYGFDKSDLEKVELKSVRHLWPLKLPAFYAVTKPGVSAFPVGELATGISNIDKRKGHTSHLLAGGALDKFALLVLDTSKPAGGVNKNQHPATLVVYKSGGFSVSECRQTIERARTSNPHNEDICRKALELNKLPAANGATGRNSLSESAEEFWGDSSGLSFPQKDAAPRTTSSPDEDIWN